MKIQKMLFLALFILNNLGVLLFASGSPAHQASRDNQKQGPYTQKPRNKCQFGRPSVLPIIYPLIAERQRTRSGMDDKALLKGPERFLAEFESIIDQLEEYFQRVDSEITVIDLYHLELANRIWQNFLRRIYATKRKEQPSLADSVFEQVNESMTAPDVLSFLQSLPEMPYSRAWVVKQQEQENRRSQEEQDRMLGTAQWQLPFNAGANYGQYQ